MLQLFLLLFLLGYLALNIFAFFYAERLIFLPRPRSYQDSPEILKLTTLSGEQISALYLPNPTATYTVLYSHGNAEDLGRIRQRLEHLKTLGVSVFAYDYRGYGTSQGTPSEQNAYQDIESAYRHLTVTLVISPNHIILYGRSLGSGTSVEIASREPIAGLILEGPFTSIFRIVTRIAILPFDRFDNRERARIEDSADAIADYGINAVCTHLGCVVPWNQAENKFMCPCHGSQYNDQGKVVRGPAPLSLALVHADVVDDKISITPWTEADFRTGEDPWWA